MSSNECGSGKVAKPLRRIERAAISHLNGCSIDEGIIGTRYRRMIRNLQEIDSD